MIFNVGYLKGAVKIIIKGPAPERFINLCMSEEITLWSITKQEDGLVAWISLRNFFKIRSLVRKSQTQVKVISFFGFPFAVKRAKGRKMLIIGAVLFFIFLNLLSSYVWFIEITGLKQLPDTKIMQITSQNGLKRGSLRENIDVKKVEKEILLNVPEISWVGISFNGTKAIIEVVEKTMPRIENRTPANLVALKDGVIEEIIALSGQAVVKKGDTVKKGDILIKGVSQNTAGNEAALNGDMKTPLRAKGIVKAKVWYESYAEINRILNIATRTGNKQAAVILKIDGREFNLKSASEPFSAYETQSTRKQLGIWRNSRFNVEMTIITYHEITIAHEELPFEQACNQARVRALNAVQSLIPENAQVLASNFEVISTLDGELSNIVRVRVNVETIEDIEEVKEIEEIAGINQQ